MATKKKVQTMEVPVMPEYKPYVNFEDSFIPPQLLKGNVGDTVKFVVEGKITEKSERDDRYTGRKRRSASVEINKIKPHNTTKKTTETPVKKATKKGGK